MERNKVKQGVMLLTYAAILVLVLVYCKDILHGIAGIISLIKPFIIGVGIAFVLHQPYSWFSRTYEKKCKMKPKTAHYLAIVSSYLSVVAVLATVFGVVIPQIIRKS